MLVLEIQRENFNSKLLATPKYLANFGGKTPAKVLSVPCPGSLKKIRSPPRSPPPEPESARVVGLENKMEIFPTRWKPRLKPSTLFPVSHTVIPYQPPACRHRIPLSHVHLSLTSFPSPTPPHPPWPNQVEVMAAQAMPAWSLAGSCDRGSGEGRGGGGMVAAPERCTARGTSVTRGGHWQPTELEPNEATSDWP